ncbi:MAG: translocation/assembly module TamB domain-containing protein [Bacteroidota bacterium]
MDISPQLRRLIVAVAAVLAGTAAVLAGFFVFLHTGPGERWLSGKLEDNVAGLELDGFHLGWPFRMRADALRLSDSRGTWLEATGFELVWHPLRLWRQVLDVDRLVARQVELYRLPESEGGAGGRPLPLPDSLRLDEVRLPIVLAPSILGQRLALELAGTARMIGGGGPVELSLRAQGGDFARIAGTAGTDYLDLRWYLQLPDLARWQHIAGVTLNGAASGAGYVVGRLPSPEISGRLDMGNGAVDSAGWNGLSLTGRVVPDGPHWNLALQADVSRPQWEHQPLPVDSATLALLGDVTPATGGLRLGDARLTTPAGAVQGAGIVTDWGRHTVLRLSVSTAALGGHVAARGLVAGDLTTAALNGRFQVRGAGITTGNAMLDRVLSDHPDGRLSGTLRGGRLFLGPSRLSGSGASLQATGSVLPRLDLWARMEVPDAAVFTPSATGAATAFAHTGGTLTAPTVAGVVALDGLAVSGAPPANGTLAFDLPEPTRPRGHLSAALALAGAPISAQARVDQAKFDDVVVESGASQVRGTLMIADGVRGHLTGTIPQLQQWQGILGRPLSGRVEAEAVLDPQRGQSVRLSVRGSDLAVDGLALPTAALRLDADGLTTADRHITIAEAAVNAAGTPISLTAPTMLEWRRDAITLAPARLAVGSGQTEVTGQLRGGELAAHARLTALPLALASADATGTMSGNIDADGPLASPHVRFALTGRDLALVQGTQAGLGRLSGRAEGDWRQGRLSGHAELSDGNALRLTAEGSVVLPGDGVLDARLHANGDAGRLAESLPLGAHVVAGRLEAAATVGGTVHDPRIDGHAVLRGGRYENLDAGTVVTPLQAEALLAGNRVTLTAQGGDGGGGSLRLNGGGTLDGDIAADIALERFTALRRDDIEAVFSGDLRLADGRLSGAVTVPRAEIDVGRLKGGGPVRLEVVEINRPGAPPAKAQAKHDSSGPALALAVQGRVEHAFVRGHGLDSEWQGDLAVAGTTAAPSLTGRLTAARGQMDVLGKAFKLTPDSAVVFQGEVPPDPALSITAEAATVDITAQVQVAGTAKAPEMTFTSSPPLPQDEVLARLLFGREAGKLSAFQQIQLAQMAAGGLTGEQSGFDPVGELRGFLGLDVLGIGSETDRTGKDNPTLSAGRYVGRDTFVRVDQGTTGLGRFTVEQGVGGGFSVESYVGELSGGGVGLTWRKDY